jgi:hypothetical protein
MNTQPQTEFEQSLNIVMNHNITRYRCVNISKIGNKFYFLRMETNSIEEAHKMIDEMWNHINSKPFNQ